MDPSSSKATASKFMVNWYRTGMFILGDEDKSEHF